VTPRDARIETAWRNHDPPRLFPRVNVGKCRPLARVAAESPRLDALVQVCGIAGLAG
jgi:hypothetical protein